MEIDESRDPAHFKVYSKYVQKLLVPSNDKFIFDKFKDQSKLWPKYSPRENFYKRMEKDTLDRLKKKQMINLTRHSPQASSK